MDDQRFTVFDFDQDDEVEIESAKLNAKYRRKKTKKASPITKYMFLQYFSSSSSSSLKKTETELVLQVPDDDDSSSTQDPGPPRGDNVETTSSNHRLESNISTRAAGNRNKKSVVKQLRGAVYDPQWSKQEENKSIDVRNDDTWNATFDSDKSFEDVVYPKGDPDAVTINKRDLELLEPDTFINDTIIDFYILYLKSNIQPEEKHRFHFFNSFFYRKLSVLEKDPLSSLERRAAFQRVRKWTRKVNLFEKDYIFIPINYRLHWSLIVICHPGEVANCEDEGIESLPMGPCILHMDSIKGSHRDLKNLVQRFLCEEWKERSCDRAEGDSLRFLQLRFFELELPQQENFTDCGLFLLHYVERFLEEAPVYSSHLKNTELSNFLKKDWFPPAEASLKRHQIKKLLYDIIKQSREVVIDDCINLDESPQALKNTDNEKFGIKTFCGLSNTTPLIHGDCYSAHAHGVGVTSAGASFPSYVQCSTEWGRVADANHLQSTANNKMSCMSPIQEEEQMADSPVYIEACQKDTALPSDLLPRDTPGSHGLSKNIGVNADVNSISDTSSSGSDIEVDGSLVEAAVFNCTRKPEKPESSSSWDLTACVVQDSEEESEMQDGTEVICISSSLANQQANSLEQNNHKEINILSSSEDQASESDDRRTPKRARLKHHVGRRRPTRSLMKDLHL